MAIKAKDQVTIIDMTDVSTVIRIYPMAGSSIRLARQTLTHKRSFRSL